MRPQHPRQPIPPDYDEDPARFRLARTVLRHHAHEHDIHPRVARRILDDGSAPVLDVGCGEGELARFLPDHAWVGIDRSPVMLTAAPSPTVLGDATALPFRDASFGAVALLYMLYHLPEPTHALIEARRVLRPGGLVAVAAPSRHDSPELADVLTRSHLTFDAELAAGMLAELFIDVHVDRWDAPLVELPDRPAVRDYLLGKGVAPDRATAAARTAGAPLTITKRGAVAYARVP